MWLSTEYQHYECGRTSVSSPELIGFYSLNGEKEYRDDYSEVKFITNERMKQDEVCMDLKHNSKNRKKKTTTSHERLNKFLQYFKFHRDLFDVTSKEFLKMEDVPFVCRVGTLGAIGRVPYEFSESFRMSACLANGVIYLQTLNPPKNEMTEMEDTMTGWGFKFEQFVVSDSPQSEPDTSSPVDENREFHCVLTMELGKHKLIYGSEVDGMLVDKESEPLFHDILENRSDREDHEAVTRCFKKQRRVEIKTSRIIENERQMRTLRKYKSLNWWLQSYFSGMDSIVCGFRDDNGIVKKIAPFKTQELPNIAERWSDTVCINFCHEFLSFVKRALVSELSWRGYADGIGVDARSHPVATVILNREPGSDITIDKPRYKENFKILEDWFVQMIK